MNDAPVLTSPYTHYDFGFLTSTSPLALEGMISGITATDVDSGGATVSATLVLSGGSGLLEPIDPSGAPSVVPSGPATSITVTGTITQVDSVLSAGFNYERPCGDPRTPCTPPETETLQIDISDSGSSGSGGPMSDSLTITIYTHDGTGTGGS